MASKVVRASSFGRSIAQLWSSAFVWVLVLLCGVVLPASASVDLSTLTSKVFYLEAGNASGKVIQEDQATHALSFVGKSTTRDLSQLWIFAKSGEGYTLRNLQSLRYVQPQGSLYQPYVEDSNSKCKIRRQYISSRRGKP